MKTPRYSIVPIERSAPGGGLEREYMIEIHDEKYESQKADGITYGSPRLGVGNTFATMRDPHDAIVFCRFLNETL